MSDAEPPKHDFAARLAAARVRREAPNQAPGRPQQSAALGFAFRIGVELVSALAVGVAIGYGLDRWFGTLPIFMVVFFFLGAAAGVLNVFRATKGLGYAVGYRRPGDSPDDKKS